MPSPEPIRILIVDDDADHRDAIAQMVTAYHYSPVTAENGEEALERMGVDSFHAIVTDLIMPRMDGFELLRTLLDRGDLTPAIVLTNLSDVSYAVSVVHDLRAFWFLEKPVQPQVLGLLLERAIRQENLIREAGLLQRQAAYRGSLIDMVGSSPAMQQVFSLIQTVAPSTAPVLIGGESGAGKELTARAIHKLSPRADAPFVAINCAALPENLIESELFGHERGAFTGALTRRQGVFEQAHRGTLFLDEIAEMPIATQAKLLRVLQDGQIRRLGGRAEIAVEVRIVAATNRPLDDSIKEKRIREDLYYRLNVFQIQLPPLRQRKQDFPALVDALIRELNARNKSRVTGVDSHALARLMSHSWPGNVRELRNVLERAMVLAGDGMLHEGHFPATLGAHPIIPNLSNGPPPQAEFTFRSNATLRELEAAYIQHTLKLNADNKRRTAKVLGIGERTLHSRLA